METVERQVTLPASPEEVWDLLTRPEELATWLGDDVVLDPTPGAAGRVLERDGQEHHLTVEEVDEAARLSWRWWTPGDHGQQTDASRVVITLTPSPSGTVLRVVEELPRPVATARASSAPRAEEAWSHRLLHLEALLLVAAAVRG
jgi:uncharacterized protein YndB with AHSA1/START domain